MNMKKRFLLIVLTISGYGPFLIGENFDLKTCEDACADKESPFIKGTIVCYPSDSQDGVTDVYYREKVSCKKARKENCGQQKKCKLACVKAQEEPCSGWFRLVKKQTEQELLKPTPAANTDTEEETTAAE